MSLISETKSETLFLRFFMCHITPSTKFKLMLCPTDLTMRKPSVLVCHKHTQTYGFPFSNLSTFLVHTSKLPHTKPSLAEPQPAHHSRAGFPGTQLRHRLIGDRDFIWNSRQGLWILLLWHALKTGHPRESGAHFLFGPAHHYTCTLIFMQTHYVPS